MRVHIKGGAWKNTEDEILKVAVMKYGKYQWGRIASLFNKKSAKQCKARWYEWLDPAIKKTEWSREEDEKLLHAAKVMPTQWRSIASVVGRTASQCLDRYEKLLDAATLESGDQVGEEARKLRVGEVDPHPESKPALPDAVDMEEEEKEMLQEARARMANTSGKKVKRKAREKQLEEARRLAVLQRKRELKAAGIVDMRGMGVGSSSKRKKGVGSIEDWASNDKEIPFHHTPLAGFHDATEELNKPPPPVDFKAMSIKARTVRKEDEEEKKRKADLAKQKQKMENDPVKALEELLAQAEQRRASIRRASALTTPSPQLSEEDMKTLAKMTYDPSSSSMQGMSVATGALLAPYNPSNANATPRTASSSSSSFKDPLLQEASLQASRRHLQTPLLTSNMPPPSEIPQHPAQQQNGGGLVLGSWKDALSTPNPLATPLLRSDASSGPSPSVMGPPSSTSRGAAPSSATATPLRRDHFGLNTPSGLSTPIDVRQQQLNQKLKLQAALSSLPAPRHTEFQIELPEEDQNLSSLDYSRPSISGPIDVADIEKKAKAEALIAQQEKERMRSTALKRGLPRPSIPPSSYALPSLPSSSEDPSVYAMELLTQETMSVVLNDCAHWPVAGHAAASLPTGFAFDSFSPLELQQAKSLLDQEISAMQQESPISFDLFVKDWQKQFEEANQGRHADSTAASSSVATPKGKTAKKSSSSSETGKAGGSAHISTATKEEAIARLSSSFQLIKSATDTIVKKSAPLEKKLGVFHAGYSKRNEMLSNEISTLVAQCLETSQDLSSFQAQLERETMVQPQRLREATEAMAEAKEKEKELQRRFQALTEKRQQQQAV